MDRATDIAATISEFEAAEAIAAQIRTTDASSLAGYRDLGEPGDGFTDGLAAAGLQAGADLPVAIRVAATVDLLLAPAIDRYDETGSPLSCPDCGRPTAWDEQRLA